MPTNALAAFIVDKFLIFSAVDSLLALHHPKIVEFAAPLYARASACELKQSRIWRQFAVFEIEIS